ncbi:MAG: N-6 DNA methylase [Dermatophilaceae bacterium]
MAAESGPSEIRRWLLESDLVDAIVALPTNMFFNTGIATYIWILDNTKAPERKGKVQLIDATGLLDQAPQEPRCEGPRGRRRRPRAHPQALRRLRRERALQDLRHRLLRLLDHHCRTTARRRERQCSYRFQGSPEA